MKIHLVVLTPGKSEGKVIPITLSQFLIGRDPQCQLRPASQSISKRHCALLVRGGKVFLRDLDSTNGTFVNEQPVKGEVELHHGDKMKLGPLLFGVHIEAAPSVSNPTPAPPTQAPAAKKPTTPPPKKPAAEAVDDDSVAALLLSLQDDEEKQGGEAEVPGGSTVILDQEALNQEKKPDSGTVPAAGGADKEKDKLSAAKKENEDTAAAAKAILQKYMRRPRGGQ
jgi:pSer/pThr/pTyr-binding forkhead associated (FHA) protein